MNALPPIPDGFRLVDAAEMPWTPAIPKGDRGDPPATGLPPIPPGFKLIDGSALPPIPDGFRLADDGGSNFLSEAGKGIVRGAGTFAGSMLQGGAALDPAEAFRRDIDKYRADLLRVPTMRPEELDAFRKRLDGENTVTRWFIGGTIDQIQSGAVTPEDIAAIKPPAPIVERELYKAGTSLSEAAQRKFPVAPGWEGGLTATLSEGFGSLLAGFGTAVVGGPAVAGAGFTAAGAGEAAQRAVEFDKAEKAAGRPGLSEEQIATAAVLGVGPGATDLIPIETMMGVLRVPAPFRRPLARAVARIGGQAFIEGVQEGGQQYLQNLIAQEVYNPDQDLGEGVLPNVGAGAGVGGIAQTLLELIPGRSRGRTSAQPQPQPQPAPVAAQPAPAGVPEGAVPAETLIPAPPAETDEADAALLRGAGWSDEQIADMADEERVAAVEEARAQGAAPAAATPLPSVPPPAPPAAPASVPPGPAAAPAPPASAPAQTTIDERTDAYRKELEAAGVRGVPLEKLVTAFRTNISREAPDAAPNDALPTPGAGADAGPAAADGGGVEAAPEGSEAGAPVPGEGGPDQAASVVAPLDADRTADGGNASAVVAFRTAKGSTYTVNEDGGTTRIKAARSDPGHEGDFGLKDPSAKTVYLDPKAIQALAPPSSAKWRLVDMGDGTFSLATLRPDGQWGVSPSARNIKASTKPAVGLAPLEMWEPETVNGRPAYGKIHPGNPIVEITDAAAGAQGPQPEAASPPAPSAVEVPAAAPLGDGSRAAPVAVTKPQDVAIAESRVDIAPTDAMKEAGNYRKAHISLHGLDITIENPKGSIRSGKSAAGEPWSVAVPATYGYIKGSEGADGDHVDVYVGDKPDADRVYVVDQKDLETNRFDEHKALIGFASRQAAIQTYRAGFSDGKGGKRIGGVKEMSVDEFKAWLKEGDTAAPVAMSWQVSLQPRPQRKRKPGRAAAGQPPAAVATAPETPTPTAIAAAEPAARPAAPAASPARKPARRQAERPVSLVAFLKGIGGIREESGELAAMNLHRRFPGLVNNAKGKTHDYAREAAAEAGYFDHIYGTRERAVAESTPADLRAMLAEGDQAFPAGDEEMVAERKAKSQREIDRERHAAAVEEIVDFERANGLRTDDLELNERAAYHLSMMEPAEALERAAIELEEDASFDEPDTVLDEGVPFPEGAERGGLPEGRGSPERAGEAEAVARDGDQAAREQVPDDRAPEGPQRLGSTVVGRPASPPTAYEHYRPNEAGITTVKKEMSRLVGLIPDDGRAGKITDVQEAQIDELTKIGDDLGYNAPIDPIDPVHFAKLSAAQKRAALSVEKTSAGQQTVLPGAERISDADLARRKASQPLKPKAPQKPADEGLFGDDSRQTDLIDLARKDGQSLGSTASGRAGIRALGLPAGDLPVISRFKSDGPLKAHPDYAAAKAGDVDAAIRLVPAMIDASMIEEARRRFGPDVIYVAPHAAEAGGLNKIPQAMARYLAETTDAEADREIVQTSTAHHTGARPLDRLLGRPIFAGAVVAGRRYVLVDDATVMGGTLAELAGYIRENGADVAGIVTLVDASRSGIRAATKGQIRLIEGRYGDVVRSELLIDPAALTGTEAGYLSGFRDADALRAGIAKARQERGRRLGAKGLRPPAPDRLEPPDALGDTAARQTPPQGGVSVSRLRIEAGRRQVLERALSAIVRRIAGKDVSISFEDRIAAAGAGDAAYQADMARFEKEGGSLSETAGGEARIYSNGEALVRLALADPLFEPTSSAYHEAYHVAEATLMTDAEFAAVRDGPGMPMIELAARQLGIQVADAALLPAYEIRAIAFERYARARDGGASVAEAFGAPASALSRFFERLRRLLAEVKRLLGRQGITRVEDIFEAVYRGDMANRPKVYRDLTSAEAALFGEGAEARVGTVKVGGNAYGAIRVYHGSPHDFDKFELSDKTIGTGEGAQAYGHGLYFAENPSVASEYKLRLGRAKTGTFSRRTIDDAEDWARRAGSNEKAASQVEDMLSFEEDPSLKDQLQNVLAYLRGEAPLQSRLYEVSLNAHPDDFLDWDKPLGEQSPRVLAAVEASNILPTRNGRITVPRDQPLSAYLLRGPKAAEALRASGLKGIRYKDAGSRGKEGGTSNYVVFDDSIIEITAKDGRPVTPPKAQSLGSVVPHSGPIPGTFIGDRVDRFRSRVRAITDPARVYLQDRYLAVKRLQEAVEAETGVRLTTPLDAYQAIRLYVGRAGERLVDLQKHHVEPLIEDMRTRDVDGAELDEYLYARHAPERNAEMAKVNPDIGDAGSGMSNERAAEIIARIKKDGRIDDFKALAERVDRIIAATRAEMVRAGLIDAKTSLLWKTIYPNYVPLRGFDDLAAGVDEHGIGQPRTGRGFDVRGPESHRALGRASKADSPLAYVVMQAEQAIVRAEKNRTLKTVLRFAQEPAMARSGLFKVDRAEMKRRVNPTSGVVETYAVPPQFSKAENLFAVKIGGKTHWIEINHAGYARALRGVGASIENRLGRALLKISHTYAAMLTQWNPAFVPTNAVRDIQTALVNVSEFKNLARNTRWRILKDAFTLKSVRGAVSAMYDLDSANPMKRWFEEYRLAGGKVSFIERNDVDAIKRRINALLKAGDIRRGLGALADLVGNLNTAVENGVRLSVYANLRENGVEQDRAAMIARDLTTDFNLRGEWSPAINALFIFFNASMQGTIRLARAVARSKTARIAVASIFSAGFAMEFLNAMIAGGDDDDRNPYDEIPDYKRARNMIVMLPGGDHISFPLAYGYNVPFLAGQQLAAVLRGKRTVGEATLTVGGATIDAFNPLGTIGSIGQLVAPWFVDPFIQSGENKNFFGGPIMPTVYDEKKPLSETYFKSAPTWAKAMARWLNETTGGNVGRPGLIDISPEDIQHFAEFAGGGVGRFMVESIATADRMLSGEEWLPEDTPIVRSFYSRADTSAAIERNYFDAWAKIDQAHYEQAQLEKAGDHETKKAAAATYRAEIAAYAAFKFAEKRRAQFKKQTLAAERIEDEARRKERLAAIDADEKAAMERALDAYAKALAKADAAGD